MNFNYINNSGEQSNFTVNIGDKWNNIKCDNKYLTNIFSYIDNKCSLVADNGQQKKGDGLASIQEIGILSTILANADNYFKSRKADSILQQDEAKMLFDDITDFGMSVQNSIKFYDISEEKLKQLFPEDKYKRILLQDGRQKICDQKSGAVYVEIDGEFTTIYTGNEHVMLNNTHGGYGDLFVLGEKEIFSSEDIASKLASGYTNVSLLKHHINKKNICDILRQYENITGLPINNKFVNKKDENTKQIYEYLTRCYEEAVGYTSDYNNNSQVKNEWHTGDSYLVNQKGNILIIKNKQTGKKTTIDLEKFIVDASMEDSVAIKEMIRTLPGEVLQDLSIEADYVNFDMRNSKLYKLHQLLSKQSPDGFYHLASQTIYTDTGDNTSDVLVHELGHSVHYSTLVPNLLPVPTLSIDFITAYTKEIKLYKEQGNKAYSSDEPGCGNYCTANLEEMFAECYSLLMLGKCLSDEVIKQYFPKTLKEVENLVEKIRKKSDFHRHSYQY